MKKKILVIIGIFLMILTGCELGNTPTSKVEDLLSRYQMLDDSIAISYVDLANDTDIDNDMKERYEALIRKQYQNLSYEIKEESIDGNIATITVEIEVIDYASILEKYDKENLDDNYHETVLKAMEDTTEKATYTIEFITNKDKEGDWKLEPLNTLQHKKMLGINL